MDNNITFCPQDIIFRVTTQCRAKRRDDAARANFHGARKQFFEIHSYLPATTVKR